ncbi:MAG TPA: hypothetical protein VM842_06795 [Nitrospira sp.]|nr:hypothetical protein [Nitrospira sp.]
MFRPVRLFTSKNRRTAFPVAPFPFPSQPAEDRVRVLRQQWADVLVLPTCLILLAFYEWWRWLFSIPANPLLLTMVAAVALIQLRRRWKMYRAELNRLQSDKAQSSSGHRVELIRSKTYRL